MSRQGADDLLTDLLTNAQGRPLDYVVLRALVEEASEDLPEPPGVLRASEVILDLPVQDGVEGMGA